MRNLLRLLALVCLIGGSAFAQEKLVDNPEYQNWAKFKAGAFAKLKTVVETNVGGQTQKIETTMTTKLIELTADKVVLEMSTSTVFMGTAIEQPPMKRDVPKQVTQAQKEQAETPKAKVEEGTEDVTLNGQKYACKWIKTKTSANGMDVVSKIWTCPDVPGQVVKMETDLGATGKQTMQLVEVGK